MVGDCDQCNGTERAGAAFRVTLIPEPATLSLFGLAMIGLVGAFRRRG